MAIILKNAPKTEEGRRLNFSEEDEEQQKSVPLQCKYEGTCEHRAVERGVRI